MMKQSQRKAVRKRAELCLFCKGKANANTKLVQVKADNMTLQ